MNHTTLEHPKLERRVFKDPHFPFVFDLDTLWWIPPIYYNWHEEIEIYCCHSGKGIIKCNDQSFELSPGDTCYVGAMVIHATIPLTDDFSYYCVIINKDFFPQNGIDDDKRLLAGVVKDEQIPALFHQMKLCCDAQEECYELNFRAYLLQILCQIFRSAHTLETLGKTNTQIETVRKILTYIEQSYANKITLDDIAKLVGLNRYHITRVFKEITGITIFEYINTVRCGAAKEMIDAGRSVWEAATKCGYSNQSYFTKVYKKIYGVIPSQHKLSSKHPV